MDRRSVLFAALATPLVHGQDTGFAGTPLVRVDSDEKETKRTELSDTAGEKYQCRIVRKGRKYLWASRNNRELTRSDAGDWTYYVSPEGSGYVKVFHGAAEMPFDYMEHVTGELKTVTYWGKRT
jgi:hypothetical protein